MRRSGLVRRPWAGEMVLQVDVTELVDCSYLAQYAASFMGVGEEGGQVPGDVSTRRQVVAGKGVVPPGVVAERRREADGESVGETAVDDVGRAHRHRLSARGPLAQTVGKPALYGVFDAVAQKERSADREADDSPQPAEDPSVLLQEGGRSDGGGEISRFAGEAVGNSDSKPERA